MGGNNGAPEILDLDALQPPKRVVKFAGREIDVSIIPFEVYLLVARNVDKLNALETGVTVGEDGEVQADGEVVEDGLRLIYDIVERICAVDGDAGWVRKLDAAQATSLIAFLIRPLFQRVAESKNALAAGPR